MIFQNVQCPVWALAGLIADDYTGLTDGQKSDITAFKASCEKMRSCHEDMSRVVFSLANTEHDACKELFVVEHNDISSTRFELCVFVSVVFE